MSPIYQHLDLHRPQERQPTVRSRANITSACLACKRRKRKCQGGNPCPHCATLKIECCYDERLDKRRKAFNDKARAESDFQRKILGGLIQAIKSENADSILEMVRADASLDEIADKLDVFNSSQNNFGHGHPSTAQHAHARDLLPIPSLLQQQSQHSQHQHEQQRDSRSGVYGSAYSPTRSSASSTSRVLDIGDLLLQQPQTQSRNEPSLLSSQSDQSDCRLPPLNMVYQHQQQQQQQQSSPQSPQQQLHQQPNIPHRILITSKPYPMIPHPQSQPQQTSSFSTSTSTSTSTSPILTTNTSHHTDTPHYTNSLFIPTNHTTMNKSTHLQPSPSSPSTMNLLSSSYNRKPSSLENRRRSYQPSSNTLLSPVHLVKGRTC